MRVPVELIVAITRAVERQGGDIEDIKDLVLTWERVQARNELRADAMRRASASARCVCADEPAPGADGRCSRCFGQPKTHSQTNPGKGERNA